MADFRPRERGRAVDWRDRDTSIFSDDDDRWSSGRWSDSRRSRDDDRGFLDRAGDEVRSWFGDEEAERRRERDMMRADARSAFGGSDPYEPPRSLRGGDPERSVPGWGRHDVAYDRSMAGEREYGGRAPWDENYRRWRDRQIEQFDREYDEYRRERQQAFEEDFDRWRRRRQSETGPSADETSGAAARAMSPGQTGNTRSRSRGSAPKSE